MKINLFDLFKYVFKWKVLIIGVVILSILSAYIYTSSNQSYVSQVVLQYNDESISSGNTPDGKLFDPYEIVSPDVITAVINELSLNKSVDNIRSRVTINSIIPTSEKDKEEQQLKLGNDYTYHPNTYSIAYTGKVGESEAEVRDVLDSIVQNYLNYYVDNYISKAAINDVVFDEDIGNYDYIEIAELITDRIDSTKESLSAYTEQDNTFRSSVTGESFMDIFDEYNHLQEYVMSKIFSNIYRGQISKNKKLLLEKYTNIMEQFELSRQSSWDNADNAKSRMDNFAEANKEIPNAYNNTTDQNNDQLAIIDNVYGYDVNTNRHYNSETTYDDLITNYVGFATDANREKLDAEHCQEVIDKFTTTIDPTVDVQSLTETVNEDLTNTKAKMADMYKVLSQTIDDYNEANATKHLSLLTGVQYYSTKSLPLYTMILVLLGLMLSVLFAITFEIIKAYKTFEKENSSKTVNDDNNIESDTTYDNEIYELSEGNSIQYINDSEEYET